MDHLMLKAATTITDQGLFEAVISTNAVDREADVVSPEAMVSALKKWNRPLPLAWEHSLAAEDIFGVIDPQSAREAAGEVAVAGQVDLESPVGKEAWRAFKSRSIGFSFGYLTLATQKSGGVRNITELDVFEITATKTPMNNGTRILTTKAMDSAVRVTYKTPPNAEVVIEEQVSAVEDGEEAKSVDEKPRISQDPLVKEAWELVLGPRPKSLPEPQVEAEPEPLDPVKVQREAWELVLKTA